MDKITSRKNPLAVNMKRLGASRAYRDESGEFLCDGLKLLEDAVKSCVEITTVLTASNVPFPLSAGTRVYYTDQRLIDSLSPLKNAQDTLFICKITSSQAEFETAGTHILLDGVQDPGNVGSIIRTANALGIKNVILVDGCADPYNPKTIRASMGAIFRQRVYSMGLTELTELKDAGIKFIGTALHERCKDVHGVNLNDSIIAIGNEGRGLSEEVLDLCDERITIPIAPECESLNAAVAAAIIIWEWARSV